VIEFGSTLSLTTTLPSSTPDTIQAWIMDAQSVGRSIWDPEMIEWLGGNTYKLKVFSLNFAGIGLAPTVDVEMLSGCNKGGSAVFNLSSIAYDPNLTVGIGNIQGDKFGIEITVCGQLKANEENDSVSGVVGFRTKGKLAGPLGLLPTEVLENAGREINKRIVEFAKGGFERGARREFEGFLQREGRVKGV